MKVRVGSLVRYQERAAAYSQRLPGIVTGHEPDGWVHVYFSDGHRAGFGAVAATWYLEILSW